MEKRYSINESELKSIISETVRRVVSEELNRSDVRDEIESSYKTKEFDKAVHNIVVGVMNDVLTNMWTKKSLLQSFLKKK